MKITAVETTPISVPRKRAYGAVPRTALGPADLSEHGLVQVHTDTGITGLGELASVFDRRGPQLCRDVDERLTPVLIDRDPLAITGTLREMERQLPDGQMAIAGVEMALWDIAGKALGAPVYVLLGGKMRERIPLSYSVPHGQPEQMAEFALARKHEGFRTVKVKIGQGFERDLEAVRCVREAVGRECRVRVDANMAMTSAEDAIRLIERLEPYDIELLEQPVGPEALQEMAAIRRSATVPIMADESVSTPASAMQVIRHEAADVLNVYVTESGGIQNATRIFTLAEQAGVACMIGSMPELGIGTAAQIHLGIAMPNLDFDSDTCGSLYHQSDVITAPLHIEAGFAYPPDGPGLGVEIDPDAFERAANRK